MRRRESVRGFAMGVLSVFAVAMAEAVEPVTIDFNGTRHTAPDFAAATGSPAISEGGFTLSLIGKGDLGNWGSNHGSFLDNPVIGSSSSSTWLQLKQDNGNLFNLASIDVIDYQAQQAAGNVGQSVTFYGFKADHSVVTSTFTFSTSEFDRETHRFADDFGDLLSLAWNQNLAGQPVATAAANRVHMVDNVLVTPMGAPVVGPHRFTIVAFGDSTTAPRIVGAALSGRPLQATTAGENAPDESNPPHNIFRSVDQTASQLYVYSDILRDELPAHGLVDVAVDNEGIGSNRTDHAVNRLETDVRSKNPDVVILQYGINDSWTYDRVPSDPSDANDGLSDISVDDYRANLERIVQTLTADKVRVILMSPNKQGGAYEPWRNTRMRQYVTAMEQVHLAASDAGLDVDYVDVWQLYEDYVAEGGDIDDLLLDGQHPNARGHRLEADALIEMIAGQM